MVQYKKEWIYKGLYKEDLRKVLPFITKEERKWKVPAIAFDLFLESYNEKNEKFLATSCDLDTQLRAESVMGNALEFLSEQTYENGAYAYEAGDGLVGFEMFPRVYTKSTRLEIGSITFAMMAPFLWRTNKTKYTSRDRVGNWVLSKTITNNQSRIKHLKNNLCKIASICTREIEIPFGEPMWWLEVTRRMIIGKPYFPTNHLDVEATIVTDGANRKRQLCMFPLDPPKQTKCEKFNTDVFLHGECWRFARIFSMMVRRPSIPVWVEHNDGGDHIFTLCDGWFWDCTGGYLLEDLEEKGWQLVSIVNDHKLPDWCNFYRFTHLRDELDEEKD